MLQIVEEDLPPPEAGEARVRVLAAAVSLPDVEARYGRSPFPPKRRFTPGYAIVGDVDAVGPGVTSVKAGDRVAALDPAQVVPLILNSIVAYQTLHRSAKAKSSPSSPPGSPSWKRLRPTPSSKAAG